MDAFINELSRFGQASLNFFWFPLLIWTAVALLVYMFLRVFRNISSMYQYHIRAAILAALPAGLISWSLLNWYLAADAIQSTAAKIIVVMNPISVPIRATPENSGFSLGSPDIWLGAVFTLILLIAIYQLIRFFSHFVVLHSYKKSMQLNVLKDYPALSDGNRKILWQIPVPVRLGISEQPQVPSTFGWKKPVIVVPALLCGNPAKLNLAIRHELVHIKQNDYVINTGVQFINQLFRFHPLVWILSKEIHEYSEITCDDVVLSDTSIPVRPYAYLLFEMLQLPVLNRKNIINMANPDSNIKKRITAMTNTNRKTKSIHVSLTLFTLIMVSISMIMACSGLQNQDTSGQDLVGQQFQISSPSISVNGQVIQRLSGATEKGAALGIMYLKTPAHGTFLISGQKFDGAQPVGTIKDKTISFNINQMNVQITSNKPILPVSNTNIWVKHVADDGTNSSGGVLGFAPDYQAYQKLDFSKTRNYQMGPDGQPIFVVVEKMPKLIGGLAGIQAKLQYPEIAKKAGIEGRVYVEFTVDKKGNVKDAKVVRGIGGGCDQAALKAVEQAKFVPGEQKGKPVEVRYSLPIVFSLSNNKQASQISPLYILNGKMIDKKQFQNINPKSLLSINVLKGDKAIQKYGDKGKNGVIIIKTKK